jgi:methionine-rich copper-binding protein CopC
MKALTSTLLGAWLLLALTTSLSLAHTTATTSPKSGSVLSASPAAIEIKFEHEASLTSVVVTAAGKPDRKLEYSPKSSAKSFTISNANLAAGRNEIQWKALSKDGHVVSGSIVLTIDPAVQKTH